MLNKWVGDCAATDVESQRLRLHSLIWATEEPCLQAFWIHQLSRCNTRFQHDVSDRLPSWNYLNEFMYKPTVWTFGHLLYNNIANWCLTDAGARQEQTEKHAPWIIFELLFSFKIFAAAAHLFQDLQKVPLGQPWLGIATDSYSYLQGSKIMRFPFLYQPSSWGNAKKWAAIALEWKQFLHNLIALCCYSLTCAVCICKFTEMFASRSNLMGLVHLCANIWKQFTQFSSGIYWLGSSIFQQ